MGVFSYRAIIMSYYISTLESPLGPLLAVSNAEALCALDFLEPHGIEKILERSGAQASFLKQERSTPIKSIEMELKAYFSGHLSVFKTPLSLKGTFFQKEVWETLLAIPYGVTLSYKGQATAMGRVSAVRAVANANGVNPLVIVIPCHRVIQSNGSLGGYGGGIARKQWLLEHEERILKKRENA
jgi:AraC family transcriptional regulator, regulatory protein of adaptative response / methylated-DNA-[protein]-cysteine methyltransferase